MRWFQFPSNGKDYPKSNHCCLFTLNTLRFNSLQTGKTIQRRARSGEYYTRVETFQFPSNGKAYPKPNRFRSGSVGDMFQFPSNGKAYPKYLPMGAVARLWRLCFNSLQTGKPIQSDCQPTPETAPDLRFNSLQTGKPIQSRYGRGRRTD